MNDAMNITSSLNTYKFIQGTFDFKNQASETTDRGAVDSPLVGDGHAGSIGLQTAVASHQNLRSHKVIIEHDHFFVLYFRRYLCNAD